MSGFAARSSFAVLAAFFAAACGSVPPTTLAGIPAGTLKSDAAGSPREIEIKPFYIEIREVTNAQYRSCASAGKCRDVRRQVPAALAGDNLPVVMVARKDAENYCASIGRRLPSEWEWEYAARGPRGFQFPYGDQFNDVANTAYGKYPRPGGGRYRFSAPAGAYPRDVSAFGVFDMGGNVSEWTSGSPDDPRPVVRGASWYSEKAQAALTWRELVPTPELTSETIGFRCAK